MAWIDIVFIGIIVVFAIIGLVKGLFDSILSLVASVASIFLSFWASKPVAAFLNKMADVNGFFEKFLTDKLSIPAEGAYGQTLSELASVCTLVLSMIIVFVLIKVAVWLLAKLFDSVTAQSTAASGMNRLLGLVFGAIKGFAIVIIALGITSVASIAFEKQIDDFLADSSITRSTYNYVDEWVENELQDRLDDFIKDLADYAEVPEEPVEKNYAEEVAKALDTTSYAVVTGQNVTITLSTSETYVSEDPAEQNINITIIWPATASVLFGTETQPAANVTDNTITFSDLTAGDYTVTLQGVKFTFGTSGEEGYQEYTADSVVITFTVPAESQA